MNKTTDFAQVKYTKRWFAHLDLMGFSNLVQNGEINDVLDSYENALRKFEEKIAIHDGSGVSHTWFSDTFLIFSRGESREEFEIVEQITRLFFNSLIFNQIPVRGAITYGDFYSQKTKNLFVGPALIDSYTYGEDQKWVGLILTPSAVNQLETMSKLHIYRNYRPIPDGVMRKMPSSKIRAYNFEGGNFSNDQNGLVECLKKMMNDAPPSVKNKYQMAIDFAVAAHHDYYARYKNS